MTRSIPFYIQFKETPLQIDILRVTWPVTLYLAMGCSRSSRVKYLNRKITLFRYDWCANIRLLLILVSK